MYVKISTSNLSHCKKPKVPANIAARCLFPLFPLFSRSTPFSGVSDVASSCHQPKRVKISSWFWFPQRMKQLEERQKVDRFQRVTQPCAVCRGPGRAINIMKSSYNMFDKNNTINTKHIPVKSTYATENTFNYLSAQLRVSMLGFTFVFFNSVLT